MSRGLGDVYKRQKFDTSSISSYASIDDLNLVITDSGLSENTKEIYEKAGVDLLIAD